MLQISIDEMADATGLLCTLWSKHRLTIAIAFISYIALVRLLRYRRMVKIEAPFASGKKDLSEMTVKEAHAILTQLQELEFPHAFSKARKIALLKVRQKLVSGSTAPWGMPLNSIIVLGWRYPDYVQAIRSYRPKQQAKFGEARC